MQENKIQNFKRHVDKFCGNLFIVKKCTNWVHLFADNLKFWQNWLKMSIRYNIYQDEINWKEKFFWPSCLLFYGISLAGGNFCRRGMTKVSGVWLVEGLPQQGKPCWLLCYSAVGTGNIGQFIFDTHLKTINRSTTQTKKTKNIEQNINCWKSNKIIFFFSKIFVVYDVKCIL